MTLLKPERFDIRPGLAGEGLVVDNIGKSFRGRPVVKGVSLRLGRGEVAGGDDLLLDGIEQGHRVSRP